MDHLLEPLQAGQFDTVAELCKDNARALPQLIELAVTRVAAWATTNCGRS